LRETSDQSDFPLLKDWISGLQKEDKTNFAPQFVKKARRFFDELMALSKKNFLLHSDLHHQNILSAEREPFLAIDPKGIVGDIWFEIVRPQRKVEMTGALAVRLPASSAAKTRNPLAFNQVNCDPTPSMMYLVKINLSEWRTTRLNASLEARQARRSRSSLRTFY
jgi:hypothetical protein